MIFKQNLFQEVDELLISSKLPRQNCAVQRLTNCHIDSLFFDKVKPPRKIIYINIPLGEGLTSRMDVANPTYMVIPNQSLNVK